MSYATVLQGDWIEQLRTLADASVQVCITSPPYWGLRDYGVAGQIGLEKTPDEYVAALVSGFREVNRVLRADGTLWLNLGDSFTGGNPGHNPGSAKQKTNRGSNGEQRKKKMPTGLKPKDLIGIPWLVAFALRGDGWYLRGEITWCKKVPMPESVLDRPTSATEKIFLLSKSAHYFYDAFAVRNPPSESFANDARWKTGSTEHNEKNGYELAGAQNPKSLHRMFDKQRHGSTLGRHVGFNDRWDQMEKRDQMVNGSNMRNFWVLGPEPYPESHFATFPTEIPKRAILAGTSAKGACAQCGAPYKRVVNKQTSFESGSGKSGNMPNGKNGEKLQGGGATLDIRRGTVPIAETVGWRSSCTCNCHEIVPCTVLDPFAGSGTTGQVAIELGRKAILIELNHEYLPLIRSRCNTTPGLPLAV